MGYPQKGLGDPSPFLDAIDDRYICYLAAAFFCNSQRRRTASAILLRPSGERLRFFLRLIGASAPTLADLALRVFLTAGELSPASRVRACSRREISRSISAKIFESCMFPPDFASRLCCSGARLQRTGRIYFV